jgi:hypothetical protein
VDREQKWRSTASCSPAKAILVDIGGVLLSDYLPGAAADWSARQHPVASRAIGAERDEVKAVSFLSAGAQLPDTLARVFERASDLIQRLRRTAFKAVAHLQQRSTAPRTSERGVAAIGCSSSWRPPGWVRGICSTARGSGAEHALGVVAGRPPCGL